MKLSLPVMIVATAMAVPAVADTNAGMGGASVADLSSNVPAVRSDPNNVNYQKYETRSTTRTYTTDAGARSVASGSYYQPSSGRAQMYRTYTGTGGSTNVATTNRTTTTRTTMKRKYYLAHPFFQPTEGMFGSITDLGYVGASYDIGLTLNPNVLDSMSDTSAKWTMDQFAVKEDFSYGITDKLAVLIMGRFDTTKYKFDWSSSSTPDDKMDDSGLNIFGAGIQWRFVDNEKWIGALSLDYERQQDVANEFILDLKAGYKVSKSTIYGLARGWLLLFDDEIYGNGITNSNGETFFIAYDEDAKTTFFVEAGLGVFSVLSEDWTLNLEGLFGHYDWHNQASIKGAIGWQPNDWFAMELYAKTSFYDTADGKTLNAFYADSDGWAVDTGTGLVAPAAYTKIDKYREMSFGGRIIFYF
ncbi:MAG: hypothetical protein J6T57_01695 [Alphaproteobacteria bacterium]|nr:hypothetical protein [Alphaproteobacteria bacterium]